MKFPEWLTVYGDKSFRGKCPVESAEQITFFNELRKLHPDVAAVAVHIRNEGKRSVQQTMRHKAEGMISGAADIIIPGNPALVIEMKRKDHTLCGWEPGQIEYLEAAASLGSVVCVALGYEAALKAVGDWINAS